MTLYTFPNPNWSKNSTKYKSEYYTCNFFENDLEGLSYFVGYMFGDGRIREKTKDHAFMMSCHSTDFDIIKKLKDRMQYNGPIYSYKVGEKYKERYSFDLPTVISKKYSELGLNVSKNKLSILNVSKFDNLNFYAFLRGFLDSDGSIQIRKTTKGYRMVSLIFLCRYSLHDELISEFKKKGFTPKTQVMHVYGNSSIPMKRVYFTGKECYKLMHLIYGGSTIYMDRKYDSYLKIKDVDYENIVFPNINKLKHKSN